MRWDEEGLETVRERRTRMRESDGGAFGTAATNPNANVKGERRASRESKHSIEGRRRTFLASVFPQARRLSASTSASAEEEEVVEEVVARYPIVTIEEATVDGFSCLDDEEEDEHTVVGSDSENGFEEEEEDCMDVDGFEKVDNSVSMPEPAVAATPVKKSRARPMLEQLLGRGQLKRMYEDDEGTLITFLVSFNF